MENQEMMSFFYPNLPFIHETDSWYKSPDEKNTTEDPSNGVACKNKKNKRVPWSEYEDRLLCELVAKYGEKKWKMIAEHIPGRTGKQCRQRWFYNLIPGLSKARWTEAEDLLLRSLHDLLGNRWAQIRRYLPGRSENDVKNHFHCLSNRLRKQAASPSSSSSPSSASTAVFPSLPSSATTPSASSSASSIFPSSPSFSTSASSSSIFPSPSFPSPSFPSSSFPSPSFPSPSSSASASASSIFPSLPSTDLFPSAGPVFYPLFQHDLPLPDLDDLAELPLPLTPPSPEAPETSETDLPATIDSPRGAESVSTVSTFSTALMDSAQSSFSEGAANAAGGEEMCDSSDWASYDL